MVYAAMMCEYDEYGMCDGKPRLLGLFATWAEAEDEVRKSMDEWLAARGSRAAGFVRDDIEMSIRDEAFLNGCEWSIRTGELPAGASA